MLALALCVSAPALLAHEDHTPGIPRPAAASYAATDLGPPAATGRWCFDAEGEIVRSDADALARIGRTLARRFGDDSLEVCDVTAAGVAVGWIDERADRFDVAERPRTRHAVSLARGERTDLGIAGSLWSCARGASEDGVVVGSYADGSGDERACAWNVEGVVDLTDVLGGSTRLVRALDADVTGRVLALADVAGETRVLLLVPSGPAQLSGGPLPLPRRLDQLTRVPLLPNFQFTGLVRTWCAQWGFEAGQLSPWQCHRGAYNGPQPVGLCAALPIGVVVAGLDPQLLPGVALPRVPPGGGAFALQIGDTVNGPLVADLAHAVSRTFVADFDDLFLRYAMVFENGHPAALTIQPYLEVRLTRNSGSSAGQVVYVDRRTADSTQPGFLIAPNALGYLPWDCEHIDLTPWRDEALTIQVTVSDCAQTGHYAYAYVDFDCDPPVAKADDVTVCDHAAGNGVTLTAQDVQPGMQYTWRGAGGSAIGTGTTINVPAPPAFTSFPYELVVTNPLTGCSDTDLVTVETIGDFTLGIEKVYECGRVKLTAVPLTGSFGPGTTVTWSDWGSGHAGNPIVLHPDWYFEAPVTVTVSNGCYTHTATTTAGGAPPVYLIAPNTFTPYDHDGLNDRFVVTHVGIAAGAKPAYHAFEWTFEVWDRWGQSVFDSHGQALAGDALANQSIPDWDGLDRFHGELQLDVYTYKLWLEDCATGEYLATVNGTQAPHLTIDP